MPTSLHSLCRWTFHEGVGRFVPSGVRPAWGPALETIRTIAPRTEHAAAHVDAYHRWTQHLTHQLNR